MHAAARKNIENFESYQKRKIALKFLSLNGVLKPSQHFKEKKFVTGTKKWDNIKNEKVDR